MKTIENNNSVRMFTYCKTDTKNAVKSNSISLTNKELNTALKNSPHRTAIKNLIYNEVNHIIIRDNDYLIEITKEKL